MTKAVAYDDFLDADDIDDLPDELQLPAGTWRSTFRAKTAKEDHILLTLEPTVPQSDVDPTELAAWEESKEEDYVIFHRLQGSPNNAASQLKSICRVINVTPKNLIDSECYVLVAYAPNKKNPDRPWQRLKAFAPVE